MFKFLKKLLQYNNSNNDLGSVNKVYLNIESDDFIVCSDIKDSDNRECDDYEMNLDDYEKIEYGDELNQKLEELGIISDSIEGKIITEDLKIDFEKNYKIDYQHELNKQQLNAVLEVKNPLLVIAGAGSGKTRVITYKVAYLMENGLKPNEILLLTFTRKVAKEMLDRVQGLLCDKSVNNVSGGTFHAFANSTLRKYGKLINIPNNFTILDPEDIKDIISLLKDEIDLPYKTSKKKAYTAFPQKGKIYNIFSKSQNLEITIRHTIEKYFYDNKPFLEDIEILYKELISYKRKSNALDYDDLINVLRDKLKENNIFRNILQKNIKYILVDEYQDVNNAQREIVELISGNKGKVTVVGDDSQSIYAFRGANFENILQFPESFVNCKVVKIEENYRSEQGILNFANDIMRNAQIGFKKNLFSQKYTGLKPIFKKFFVADDEAEYICKKILQIRDNGLEYSDFAILVRSSWYSNMIQIELTKCNIPYIVIGGIKFVEKRHIKDIVAFLKIILNPLDAIAWYRMLVLFQGVGKVTAKEIIEAIQSNHGVINFTKFASKKYYIQLKKYEELYDSIIGKNDLPFEIVEKIFIVYKPLLEQAEKVNFKARSQDLEYFLTISKKYNNLEKFLEDFSLDPPSNKYQDEIEGVQNDTNKVTISTIHSSKGLEWNTVFIPHALDGLIPSVRALKSIEDLEEERRLFYVASSRAKENLFITMPMYVYSYGGSFTKPSRFIAEINKLYYDTDI